LCFKYLKILLSIYYTYIVLIVKLIGDISVFSFINRYRTQK
jgi:hypothetical protein